MHLNAPQKITSYFVSVLVFFWCVLYITNTTSGFYNYLYSFLFGLIPLIGGLATISSAPGWGSFKSAVGKAVFFIGLGIFLWGCGEIIWSYYNFFLGVAAPYPSIADLGFAPSIFFYGLGIVYLSGATGAKFALRKPAAKAFAIAAPILLCIFSYYILVTVARGGVLIPDGENMLKTILDILYPLGDFIGLSLAVVISGLSYRYLGGRYAIDVVSLWLGLALMFIADSVFSYTTTVGTYYNADFGDLLLTLGMFFLTFGALGFYTFKTADK